MVSQINWHVGLVLVTSYYPNFQLSFIRRQTNYVVDSLTRTIYLSISHHTFEYIPSCSYSEIKIFNT